MTTSQTTPTHRRPVRVIGTAPARSAHAVEKPEIFRMAYTPSEMVTKKYTAKFVRDCAFIVLHDRLGSIRESTDMGSLPLASESQLYTLPELNDVVHHVLVDNCLVRLIDR